MSGRPARRVEVRILAGRWKGRALAASGAVRPTSARARQALFNLLGERVPGARVLDLYSGTGAVGLEAVSRGAASAVLVETDSVAIAAVLERWGAGAPEVRVVPGSVARAISRLAAARERFEIVFADPPYGRQDAAIAELADVPSLLAEGGVFVLQSDAKRDAPEISGLRGRGRRAYGRNVFHFLELF